MPQRQPVVWELVVNPDHYTTGVLRNRTFTIRGNKTDADRRLRELVIEIEGTPYTST